MFPRRQALRTLAGVMASVGVPAWAAGRAVRRPGPAPQTVRLAFIDPLSGPAADIGRNSLRSWQFMAKTLARGSDGAGDPAALRLVVAGFDNKGSPQESLKMLKAAIDQGFRFVVQGNGSGVAAALSAAIERHNQRHPEQAVLFINYAAMDPELTGARCSHWHFRIDPDTSMKMRALTRFLSEDTTLRKVYLLNQNYAHGQQFARYFHQTVAAVDPSVQVVGEELHPAFLLQDFAPYVRRVQSSGAEALVTGNWGADMRHLVRAMAAQSLKLPLLTYYAGLTGTPKALAEAGGGLSVYQVAYHHGNQEGEVGALAEAFRARHGEDLSVYAAYDGVKMLLAAMQRSGSTDAARVAARLSGMIFEGFNGPVQLRAADHQLLKGLYVSRWQRVDPRHPRDAEGTGHTFVPLRYFPPDELTEPSDCMMQRP